MLEAPVKEIKNNILQNNLGDFWAYYRVIPDNIAEGNYDLLASKKNEFNDVSRRLEPYEELHLMLVPENLDLQARFAALSADFAQDLGNVPEHFAQRQIQSLENEMGVVTHPVFYIGVKLRSLDEADSYREIAHQKVNEVLRRFYNMMNYDVEMSIKDWQRIQQIEADVFTKINGLHVERLTESETVYLSRYPYIRGTRHNVSQESDINNLEKIADTVIDPKSPGYLGLDNDGVKTVISEIVINDFQVDMTYSHLFSIADKFKFPVELNIKARYLKKDGTFGFDGKIEGLRKRFKVKTEESYQITGDEGNRSKVNRFLVKNARDEIEDGAVFMNWVAVLTVSGANEEQAKARGNQVMNYLTANHIASFRPKFNQLDLFYQMYPATAFTDWKNWLQCTTTEGFAENLFAVSNVLGNKVGWVIGRINTVKYAATAQEAVHVSKKLVMWNQLAANKNVRSSMTASPHIAVTGETGKGKSFLSKVLFFYMTLMESKALYIDPKKEFRKWVNKFLDDPKLVAKYPDYAQVLKSYHYITLDADDPKNYGALDPIVFLKGITAKTTAVAMLREIINREFDVNTELAINKAVDQVIEEREAGKKVGMLHVIDILKHDKKPDISSLGELFEAKIKNTILSLGFSNGKTEGLNLDNRVNILEISGLRLPSGRSDNVSDVERQSICLMLPLGKFCEMFGAENKDEFSVEFFDEAWIFSKSQAGQDVLEDMKRVGRSFNNTLIYTTQSINDVKADEGGQFGQIFAFDSREERKQILKHVGIELNERNLDALATTIQGQCYYRDIYGHCAIITVDPMFPELMITNKTVNKNAAADAEEKFS